MRGMARWGNRIKPYDTPLPRVTPSIADALEVPLGPRCRSVRLLMVEVSSVGSGISNGGTPILVSQSTTY